MTPGGVVADPDALPPIETPPEGPPVAATGDRAAFRVRLDNFDGPFDLLLQLISQHRMDVTEVALHRVTDDFIAYTRAMDDAWDLEQVTAFLVVAATLLDLKAARLLPDADLENPEELAYLEAKDLLFARLLAYRAFQQVAGLFRELEASALRRYPRAVTLEDRYLGLLPEVRIGMDAAAFAEMAAAVFRPKPPPSVSLDHIHTSTVSVAEHTAVIRELLSGHGRMTFAELVAGCESTMEVVARFLGLLNLYREAAVAFDQPEPLGMLTVRWTGDSEDAAAAGIATDEEYE
ncbi:segregation and condensation protein A [Nakamurella lactea]|uniref:segregation and condensation protein A n=1 Tax=Nakamurella lactea TaxID=459515 RepID=UPI000417CE8A|nr:segregation/condensation protein A [Nakamurella lactea]